MGIAFTWTDKVIMSLLANRAIAFAFPIVTPIDKPLQYNSAATKDSPARYVLFHSILICQNVWLEVCVNEKAIYKEIHSARKG
jgi:hypothetical protein